ncbi:MAG: DUF5076 domain-containing protein [Moraxellaceae bacterium]|nr:DUF5076 domain-containing protein [Moraxellaceae bacterium]
MHDNELEIPAEVLTDPDGFELMRLWAAHGELHVTINSNLEGGAEDFGELLADLFEHASRMYSQRDGVPLAECRQLMLDDFLQRTSSPKDSIEGSIPTEH